MSETKRVLTGGKSIEIMWRSLTLVLLAWGTGTLGFSVDSEGQLRSDLLGNYSAKIRPLGVTNVNLNFHLLTINDLETRTQTFSVSGYFTVVWEDNRLAWNKSDYSGIGFFFSDETELWRPALVVKNAVNDISVIADEDIPFRVNNDGRVYWNPPGIYQTNCNIDTTYYPFDTQTCSVEVQSWGYNLRELDLFKFGSGVETSEFQENGEWNLLEASSKRAERVESIDSETYATVAFDFKLKRRADYYGMNIILPVIVMSILSALVFVLPADSGEKMGYSLTVLLAFAVFLTLISDRMPTTSKHTSYMALYLSVVLIMSGLSVLLTILILDLHFREDAVSSWANSFARKVLMPLTCTRCSCGKVGTANVAHHESAPDDRQTGRKKRTEGRPNYDHAIWSGKKTEAPPVARSNSEEVDLTWKDIARLLDAFCFRLFIIAIILVTIIFFSILGTNA